MALGRAAVHDSLVVLLHAAVGGVGLVASEYVQWLRTGVLLRSGERKAPRIQKSLNTTNSQDRHQHKQCHIHHHMPFQLYTLGNEISSGTVATHSRTTMYFSGTASTVVSALGSRLLVLSGRT